METFYKMSYNPEDKTMQGWYFIESETDKTITVLNVQEIQSDGPTWASGQVDYRLKAQKIILPKSQIKIHGHHEVKVGYSLIEIPYWLYKKNEGLEIKRISVPKKFTIRDKDPQIKSFTNEKYRLALEGVDTDMNHIDLVIRLKM